MLTTDPPVICAIESALILFTLYAALRDAKIRRAERGAEVVAEAVRGEKSMTALYTVYGAAIASFLVLIDNANGIEGNKVALIVLNFLCITYMFFFSTWFRNSIFFPLNQRVRKD
jgi:tellurite resistance protein TehA-like permease